MNHKCQFCLFRIVKFTRQLSDFRGFFSLAAGLDFCPVNNNKTKEKRQMFILTFLCLFLLGTWPSHGLPCQILVVISSVQNAQLFCCCLCFSALHLGLGSWSSTLSKTGKFHERKCICRRLVCSLCFLFIKSCLGYLPIVFLDCQFLQTALFVFIHLSSGSWWKHSFASNF